MAFCATFPADVRLADVPQQEPVDMMAPVAEERSLISILLPLFGWPVVNTDSEVSFFDLASSFVPKVSAVSHCFSNTVLCNQSTFLFSGRRQPAPTLLS